MNEFQFIAVYITALICYYVFHFVLKLNLSFFSTWAVWFGSPAYRIWVILIANKGVKKHQYAVLTNGRHNKIPYYFKGQIYC
jgi:hypothetical protein